MCFLPNALGEKMFLAPLTQNSQKHRLTYFAQGKETEEKVRFFKNPIFIEHLERDAFRYDHVLAAVPTLSIY
jgi:hypothetical protein